MSDSSREERQLLILDITDVRTYDPDYEQVRRELTERIVQRTRHSGWRPLVVFAETTPVEEIDDAARRSDAVLIAGGEDVAPELYGAHAGYAREGHHFPTADARQMEVVRRCAERGTPVLGICRGLQIINVALGGTLITDLGAQTIHRDFDTIRDAFVEHPVSINAGNPLADALGEQVSCMSAHHQAIGTLGRGLKPIAFAPDGVIEAVVHESAPVMAVQWHPEARHADPAQFPALLEAGTRLALALS